MKKILIFLFFTAIGLTSKAQAFDSSANYGDTLITLTLTQRAAIYVGYYVKQNQQNWANRLAPTQLKPYIGSGANLDSVFSVTTKASYIVGLVNMLLTGQNEVVQADRLKIINNSPSVVGYTALSTQIVNKANGSTSEKNVAIYVRDYYNGLVTQLSLARESIINQVVIWSRN